MVETTKGTVYVLPADTFKKPAMHDQYKSHEPVKPIEKVEITLKDYYELGGKIEWN